MRTIRWGMIGCGEVARMKSGPALWRASNSTLVAVHDRNLERAAEFARTNGGAMRAERDADALIRAPDVDVVYVATRTDSHREYVLRCAAARKPVLVEKPMGMSHAECREMADACRAAGVPLWIAYYRRALPRFTALKDLVQSGAIGPVRMTLSRHFHRIPDPEAMRGSFWGWRLDPKVSGGGIYFEAVGHTLDILDYVIGPIERIRSFADNQAGAYPPEDVVTASWRYGNGAYGSGAWCFATDIDDEFNEIVGATGRIRYSTFPPLMPPPGRPPAPIRVYRGETVEEIPITDPPYVHQPLVQSIVDELNGQGHCASTPESAMRTARVIDDTLAEFLARRRG
ncbi:MAG: Gfo/Idh/MocA family oxidoreductase [Burkholderiales bacterium]|nr:Gfo/Idh/MocA family oxidoreductase [Burkholderiales bacterium]